MALPVIWTENALSEYKQVVDYLLKGWPVSVASSFINNVGSRIETLSVFPDIVIASLKERGVRSILLTKHNRLYYKVSNQQLEILNIFDTRQNPIKNKFD